MSAPLTKSELQALHNPNYELEQKKAYIKYSRAIHRLANTRHLEYTVNNIYNNIIENAKKGASTYTVNILNENGIYNDTTINISEIKGNSAIDISGNYIIDVFSNPILAIINNKLYDISGGEHNQELIDNMSIQGEIDISGNNIVVDSTNTVLFTVSSNNEILNSNGNVIGTINEKNFINNVLDCISTKFNGIISEIKTTIVPPVDENSIGHTIKSIIFNWE
jgi:hypothetical protein